MSYRGVIFPFRSLNTDQVKVILIEVFLGFAVLALLPAASFSPCFGLVFVLIFVGDEASAFLFISQQVYSEL